MHRFRLAALAAVVLPLSALAALPSAKQAFRDSGTRAVYIVSLADAPLAAYTGAPAAKASGGATLPATAPAALGQRKLDVMSKASRDYRAYLDARHADVLAEASKRAGRAIAPRFHYTIASNGMALELSAAEAQALRAVPGVRSVRRERIEKPTSDASAAWLGADQVWSGAQGITATRGEGVVVGILDTGINYLHPSFADLGRDGYNHSNPRGRFYGICATEPTYCNDKLIGVYDYTDEAARKGIDQDGHGSHVASTAAGNFIDNARLPGPTQTPTVTISGIAPHANIIAYKVCVDAGCPDSAVIAAMDQATADQADVINISIGGEADPWESLRESFNDKSSAALNGRFAGMLTINSAGNSGPTTGLLGTPGTSPWAISAAAASHDRTFDNRVQDVTGSGITSALSFPGVGVTAGLAKTRIVHAAQFGSALCGTGASQDTPTGASNPFPAGTFQGEIVVCDRGTYGRVEKGFNLKLAGAGGMILANAAEQGESIVADAHHLPAVHIGFAAGQQLRALLSAAQSGGGTIQGAISGVTRRTDAALGDVLADFSSRGPVPQYGGWLKPNLTAPGRNVLAANFSGETYHLLSGTSMSAPNIAGVAALIVGSHPTWSVAQIESALLTTAIADVRDFDLTPATPHEAGAGRVYAPAADRAALFFNVTQSQYIAADPVGGGRPQALNEPYLVENRCFERCSFSRTVTDMAGGGAWRVEYRGPAGAHVTISPSSFMLGANASQPIQVDFDVTDPSVTATWVYGELALVNTSGGNVPETRLPIAVFADPGDLPDTISIDPSSNTAAVSTSLSGLLAIPHLEISATPLTKSVASPGPLPQDPTPNAPYDGTVGSASRFFTLPGTSDPSVRGAVVYVALSSSTARDVDLFVGEDLDGDGIIEPGDDEELCVSASSAATERCVLELSASSSSRTFWLVVNNYAGSGLPQDQISLVAVASNLGAKSSEFVATGPGRVGRLEAFPLQFAVNEPRMQAGETWVSFLELGPSAANPATIGRVPVLVKTASAAGGAQVLSAAPVASGPNDTIDLVLAPGTAQDRIVIDVPPNATALSVQTSGSGEVDLYVAKATGADATSSAIPAAPPRTSAQGTSIHPGATEAVTLLRDGTPALTAGRWYITPVNAGTDAATARITASVTYSGAAPSARLNAYFNPSRSGHGIFLSEGGTQRVLVWYTYRPDGTPTWYLAQGTKPAAGAGAWQAPLYRFAWDGSANTGTVVGEVVLTTTSSNQLTYSWLVDGQYGSEPVVEVAPPACPQVGGAPIDYSGTWYAPVLNGYGFSVITLASTEVEVAYLYDAQGVPRWLYAQNSPFGSGSFALTQFSGFCPSCAFAAIQGRAAGTLTRTLTNARNGSANVAGTFQAPVAGTWTTNHTTTKLTDDLSCF